MQVKIDDSNTNKTLSNLQSKTDNLGKSFSKAGKLLTVGLTVPLAGLVGIGIKYNAEMEQYQAGLETMLGSTEKATKMLKELKTMANKTPFETTDLIKSSQTMLAFGMDSEETMKALSMLGDVSMGNKDKLSSLTLAFAQVQSTGRLMGQDLLQMVGQGFNPLQIISEKTGRSMKDLKKDMENGAISADMVTQAFEDATSNGGRFFGAMDKQSQTVNGKLSTLKDAFAEASGELTVSLLPAITKLVTNLTKLINKFNDLSPKQKENIVKIMGLVMAIGPLLLVLGKVISLVSGLSTVLPALGTALGVATGPIGWIVLAIVGLIGVFTYLMATSKEFREAVGNVFQGVYSMIKPWIDGVKTLLGGLVTAFKGIVLIIGGLFGGDMSMVIRGFKELFRGLINFIIGGVNMLTSTILLPFNALISGLNKLPGVKIGKISLAIPKIPAFEQGTNYTQEGLAYLHKGEAVVPKKYNPAIGGNGMMTMYIEQPAIELDGNKVSRGVTPYITRTVKLGGGNL